MRLRLTNYKARLSLYRTLPARTKRIQQKQKLLQGRHPSHMRRQLGPDPL